MNCPKVSIVMPVHNGSRFLAAAVESVLSQSLGNFELFCVEDGSTDESARIIAHFAAKDSRIRMLQTGGIGCSGARNVGLDAAQGEYIAFIDQDDLYHPEMLETLVSAAERHGADIAEAKYAKTSEDADIDSAFPREYGSDEIRYFRNPFSYFIGQHRKHGGGIVCPVWHRLFRRSLASGIRFPVGIQPGEDSFFSYLAFDRARSLVTVDRTLYAFRQNGNSTSHRGLARIADRFIAGREALLRFWADSPSPHRNAFLACATRELAWIVKEASKRGDEAVRAEVRSHLLELRREDVFLLRRLPPSKRLKTWMFLNGLRIALYDIISTKS